MRKLPLLLAMVISMAFTSSALAAAYGAAGCGWGGHVIKKNDILAQLGATILNGVSSNQTFAMTSGTSECGKGMMAQSDMEQKVFVENNYQSLAKQMAAGQGEGLDTLAGLLGCPAEQSGEFGAFAQKNYSSIFASDQIAPAEMLNNLKQELSGDRSLGASCRRI